MKLGRKFFIRIAAVLIIIIIGVVMFFIGKEHTILIDNFSQGDYKALDYFEVSVDGSPMIILKYPLTALLSLICHA